MFNQFQGLFNCFFCSLYFNCHTATRIISDPPCSSNLFCRITHSATKSTTLDIPPNNHSFSNYNIILTHFFPSPFFSINCPTITVLVILFFSFFNQRVLYMLILLYQLINICIVFQYPRICIVPRIRF